MTADLRHIGSLITVGEDQCLGYLLDVGDRGFFDANLGKLDISKEDAETHNRLLDEALIKGLDENCEVGMYGTFYWDRNYDSKGGPHVRTFLGMQVSDRATVCNRVVTFWRGGKKFRGRLCKEEYTNAFNFRRIE